MEGKVGTREQVRFQTAAAFFSLYVAIIFLISAIAFPGFRPYGEKEQWELFWNI